MIRLSRRTPAAARTRRRALALATAALLGCSLAACGSGNEAAANPNLVTVWSLENQTERFTATQGIVARFTEQTGIAVDLQAVDEGQLPQLIAQAAQAGTLPDVIGSVSLAFVRQMDTQELLDTENAAAIVAALGEDTFSPAALELSRADGRQLSVPSDAWSQILVYRKDLFEAAGLQPPDTYETLQQAAGALTADGRFGITLATDPADVFTQQTFESLALGNSCQLVDAEGTVTLASPACVPTFDLYQTLATQDSPKGTQSVDSTRESYFAGQSAMIIWSTFLLDELAGLRNDALPTCPECKADPEFLSRNSGVISAITGPDGQDTGSYGEISSWVPISAGKVDQSRKFIEFMLSDGYEDWFGLAPEGKFPVRLGDETDPAKFENAWKARPAGVDTKKPLAEVYDADTLEQITSIADRIDRWAISQGQGDILGAVNVQLPIAKVIAEMSSSDLDGAGAAALAQEEVVDVQEGL